MAFAQATRTIVAGTDGVTHAGITCFECQSNGHYSTACPSSSSNVPTSAAGVSLLQAVNDPQHDTSTPGEADFSFSASPTSLIPTSWVLLDCQSTVLIFSNPKLLTHIRHSDSELVLHTNGGPQLSRMVGDVKNFGTVWYNPSSLANILSLAEVRKMCRIIMDTNVEAALIVHHTNGTMMKFQEFSSGLYYHDTITAPAT